MEGGSCGSHCTGQYIGGGVQWNQCGHGSPQCCGAKKFPKDLQCCLAKGASAPGEDWGATSMALLLDEGDGNHLQFGEAV